MGRSFQRGALEELVWSPGGPSASKNLLHRIYLALENSGDGHKSVHRTNDSMQKKIAFCMAFKLAEILHATRELRTR